MVQAKPSTTRNLILISIGTILGFTVFLRYGYFYLHERMELINKVKKNAKKEVEDAVKALDVGFGEISSLAHQLADEFSQEKDTSKVISKLEHIAADPTNNILGTGIAYLPYAYDKDVRLYARDYIERKGGFEKIPLEKFYDYTEAPWFKETIQGGAGWREPYLSVIINEVVIRYSVPIYKLDKQKNIRVPIGVVSLDLDLKNITKRMELLNLQYSSNAILLSPKGAILFYPIGIYAEKLNTYFDLSRVSGEQSWGEIGAHMVNKESGVMDYENSITDKRYWVFFEPLRGARFSLGLMFEKKEKLAESSHLKKILIKDSLWFLVFAFFLLMLIFRVYSAGYNRWWYVTGFYSTAIIAVIGFIWFLTITQTRPLPEGTTIISDNSDLQRFLSYQNKINQRLRKKEFVYIPTNLYLTAVNIGKNDALTVQGYIWQRYDVRAHADVARGIRIPNASNANITEAYRLYTEKEEIIGWRFKADLNAEFDYFKYPLDKQSIYIRISHKDFYSDVVLTPDFESWDISRIKKLMGLGEKIALTGWFIDATYFSYAMTDYDTTFGIENFVGQREFPNLQFNIAMRRDVTNPFISSLLPVIVVLILMFGLLLVASSVLEKPADMSVIIRTVGTIFFSTIVAHQRFRSTLPEQAAISYVEYFYFLAYGFILLTTLNCLMIKLTEFFTFLRAEHNLVAKILYWPIVLGSFLALTIAIFY